MKFSTIRPSPGHSTFRGTTLTVANADLFDYSPSVVR